MSDPPGLRCNLVLASRYDSLEVAELALLELGRLGGCSSEETYWVVSALREAVANAIRHGNREDPSRPLEVEYRLANGAFHVTVSDQGQGFDLGSIPDPTAPPNVLRPSGRGIFYMRQFMDRVDFGTSDAGGTTVVMSRRVRPTQGSDNDHEEQDS